MGVSAEHKTNRNHPEGGALFCSVSHASDPKATLIGKTCFAVVQLCPSAEQG